MKPNVIPFVFFVFALGTRLPAQETVSFSLDRMADAKRGRIGFLHSILKDALPTNFVRELAPNIWRGGGPLSGDPLDIIPYLFEAAGVKRTLQSPNAFFYRRWAKVGPLSITNAAAASYGMPLLSKSRYPLEYEIINEPNLDDLPAFMENIWNTNFHVIRSVVPGAIVHGPSTWMLDMKGKSPGTSLRQLLDFIDAAIQAGTLPDYINWHFQNGQDIYEGHRLIADAVRHRLKEKGATVRGLCVGESIRPGDERNTSPAVVIDLLCAAEILDIDQIHAAWSSTPVYGQATSYVPVLDGLLTKDSTGRRGAWWTYRFYAQCKGRRLECAEGPSGSPGLVALAFADPVSQQVRVMAGRRDGQKTPCDATFSVNRLSRFPGLVKGGKVVCRIWDNPQTEDAAMLEEPSETLTLPVQDDGIQIPRKLLPWGAFLVEIGSP